ncbi:hypothetical protein [Pseudomonas kulmbachensis]|uniref:hypothetical protein n=1 Tax=Pseudomonas kulmbachensis TaxID=3043408 RepID=UPI002AB2C2D6|nr:hypothetical protein [Pseudomonas sp. V3/3/4/13]
MAKTNIERFDEMSASILAFLYDSFPIPKQLSPAVAGLTEEIILSRDTENGGVEVEGERDPETEFFESSVEWLVQSGFISKKAVDSYGYSYCLTPYGLQALKHVPLPSISSETLGEQLSNVAKEGFKSTASTVMSQVVTVGTSLMLRQLNIQI